MTTFFSTAITKVTTPKRQFKSGLAFKIALCSAESARQCLSVDIALEELILPLRKMEENGSTILYALVGTHFSEDQLKKLRFLTGLAIRVYRVDESVLEDAIFTAYYSQPLPLDESLKKLTPIYTEQQKSETGSQVKHSEDTPAFFLERLIEHAVGLSASDIHITPVLEGVLISVRRFGVLLKHQYAVGNEELKRHIITRLSVLAKIDFTKKQRALEGSFVHRIAGRSIPVRISIVPCYYGMKVALRLQSTRSNPGFYELGFSDVIVEEIKRLQNTRSGLLLFSGSAGSGKTTSSYAVLEYFAEKNLHTFSVEDPVERALSGVVQIELKDKERFSFSDAFQALLRQDPDVIYVGEIREQGLAKLALEAALSGHLIVGTIHALSAEATLKRLQVLSEQKDIELLTQISVVHQKLQYVGETEGPMLQAKLLKSSL